jgi:DNA-binding HxlR family transcriptional regulator
VTARTDLSCSIARGLSVIGQPWTILILREAFLGVTRFAEFRFRLGIAPDMLTDRLGTLVDAGVLTREPYREPGERVRDAYVLTPAGRELLVVLASIQQWADEHLPHEASPTMLRRTRDGRPLHVGFIDPDGREVSDADVRMLPR